MRLDGGLLLAIPAMIVAVEIMFGLRFATVLKRWTGVMQSSVRLMADNSLSDDVKQAKLAKASISTLGGTLKILAIMVAVVIGYLMVINEGISVLRLDTSLIDAVMRVDFQVTSLVVAGLYIWARKRVFG
jgi:hypothetical protein